MDARHSTSIDCCDSQDQKKGCSMMRQTNSLGAAHADKTMPTGHPSNARQKLANFVPGPTPDSPGFGGSSAKRHRQSDGPGPLAGSAAAGRLNSAAERLGVCVVGRCGVIGRTWNRRLKDGTLEFLKLLTAGLELFRQALCHFFLCRHSGPVSYRSAFFNGGKMSLAVVDNFPACQDDLVNIVPLSMLSPIQHLSKLAVSTLLSVVVVEACCLVIIIHCVETRALCCCCRATDTGI
jgi:hypothetical protein